MDEHYCIYVVLQSVGQALEALVTELDEPVDICGLKPSGTSNACGILLSVV